MVGGDHPGDGRECWGSLAQTQPKHQDLGGAMAILTQSSSVGRAAGSRVCV